MRAIFFTRSFTLLWALLAAAPALAQVATPASARVGAPALQERSELLAQQERKDELSPVEAMARARNTFEYGDYATAVKMLQDIVERARFESPALRAEAYRLLGISLFYLGRKGEAYTAFLELLYLEPDTELDPFYVSPGIVALFDQVRKDSESKLAPIRAQRRAELDARKKAAAEEARLRRQRELEEQQKRLFSLQPTVERRVVTREFWVSLMPFGVGQLQNGDRTLGITLATSEIAAGAASAGSTLLIEQLRDQATGRFQPQSYRLASRLQVVKWVSAGLFYALWAGGAIHAALRFQPEQPLPDRLIQPPVSPP